MADDDKPGLVRRILGGGFSQLAGTVSPMQAYQMGMPNASGLNMQQLQMLAQAPERQAQLEALKTQQQVSQAELPFKSADIRAQMLERIAHAKAYETIAKTGGKESTDMLKMLEDLDKQTSGVTGLTLQAQDPDKYNQMSDLAEQLRGKLAKKHGATLGKGAAKKPVGKAATGASGKIKVKRLADNQTGTINASDFDPSKYSKL